jgi:ABC-type branched-subunit amino acid transport system permease subunit
VVRPWVYLLLTLATMVLVAFLVAKFTEPRRDPTDLFGIAFGALICGLVWFITLPVLAVTLPVMWLVSVTRPTKAIRDDPERARKRRLWR